MAEKYKKIIAFADTAPRLALPTGEMPVPNADPKARPAEKNSIQCISPWLYSSDTTDIAAGVAKLLCMAEGLDQACARHLTVAHHMVRTWNLPETFDLICWALVKMLRTTLSEENRKSAMAALKAASRYCTEDTRGLIEWISPAQAVTEYINAVTWFELADLSPAQKKFFTASYVLGCSCMKEMPAFVFCGEDMYDAWDFCINALNKIPEWPEKAFVPDALPAEDQNKPTADKQGFFKEYNPDSYTLDNKDDLVAKLRTVAWEP